MESLSTTLLLHIFASQPPILPKVQVQEHLIEGRLQDVGVLVDDGVRQPFVFGQETIPLLVIGAIEHMYLETV